MNLPPPPVVRYRPAKPQEQLLPPTVQSDGRTSHRGTLTLGPLVSYRGLRKPRAGRPLGTPGQQADMGIVRQQDEAYRDSALPPM